MERFIFKCIIMNFKHLMILWISFWNWLLLFLLGERKKMSNHWRLLLIFTQYTFWPDNQRTWKISKKLIKYGIILYVNSVWMSSVFSRRIWQILFINWFCSFDYIINKISETISYYVPTSLCASYLILEWLLSLLSLI